MPLTSKKIQGKPTKPLSVEETAEKVRALREKQSMWMKERESEKSSKTRKDAKNALSAGPGSASSKSSGRSSSRSLSSSGSRGADGKNQYSNPRRKPLYPEPKRDNSDMISWIAKGPAPLAQNRRPPSASGQHSRHNSISRTLSREDNRNASDNNAYATSKEYKASNYGIPQQHTELWSQSQSIDSEQRLPHKFNSLGEEKVEDRTYPLGSVRSDDNEEENSKHRPVKQDFMPHLDGVQLHGTQFPPEMIAALTDTLVQRLQPAVHGTPPKQSSAVSGNPQGYSTEQGMSSHFCSLCDELMTAPRHTPTAVIPCGHSFCKACVRDCKKCPSCQTRVNSTAVNTVLQAIIVDFNAQKEKERLQQLEEETRKYVDEYQSLCMRHSALTGTVWYCMYCMFCDDGR